MVEDCEADVHVYDDHALRWAALYGHLEIVKYLIEECGADVHTCDEQALRSAAYQGHLETVKYLIEECGADVHAWYEGALRSAARSGHLEVVKYLVSKGADVRSGDDWALRRAARGQLETVKYLKSYKLSQFTKKHIDKQNLRYVFQQYELPFEIKQIISSYVLKKSRIDQLNQNPFHTSRQARPEVGSPSTFFINPYCLS